MTSSAIPDIPGYKDVKPFHEQGNMGEIYHGYSRKTGKEVIIKLMNLSEDSQEYANSLRRFGQETLIANILRAHKHDHVLAAIDHADIVVQGSRRSIPYLVYPYIAGGSLSKLLRDETPWRNSSWSLLQITDIIIQAAKGLSHLHDFGIVHQDVRPSNFLWSPVGPAQHPLRRVHVWLTDFGAAESERETRSLTSIGTLGYAAPEQKDGYIRRSADQYSLAVMARLLLTGSHPPIEEHLAHTLYTPLTQLNPKRLHEQKVDHVVLKALAPRPEDRFGSVLEFAQELQKAILQQEHLTFYSNPTEPLQPPPARQRTNASIFPPAPTERVLSIQPLPPAQQTAMPPAQEVPLVKPRIKSFVPHQPVNEKLPLTSQKPMSTPNNVPSLPSFPLQKLFSVPLPDKPTMLVWSPDDTTLVCTFYEDAPRLIHNDGKVEILSGFVHGHCACWSPDSRFLAISIHDYDTSQAEIRFWDRATRKERYQSLWFRNSMPIYGLDWSSSGHLALWLERGLFVYDFSTLSAQTQLPPPYTDLSLNNSLRSDKRSTLRWSPDGTWLAAGANNGKVLCWNPHTSVRREQQPLSKSVNSMNWSPNSKIVVAAFVEKRVLFWDLETGSIAWERLPEIPMMVSISSRTAQLALATEKMLFFGRIGDSAPTASHPGQQIVAWSTSNKLATLDKDDDTTLVIWQA